jgi:hypothetical protein
MISSRHSFLRSHDCEDHVGARSPLGSCCTICTFPVAPFLTGLLKVSAEDSHGTTPSVQACSAACARKYQLHISTLVLLNNVPVRGQAPPFCLYMSTNTHCCCAGKLIACILLLYLCCRSTTAAMVHLSPNQHLFTVSLSVDHVMSRHLPSFLGVFGLQACAGSFCIGLIIVCTQDSESFDII